MTTRLERIAGGLAAMGPPDGAARAMVREAGVDTLGCVLGGAMVPDAMRARAALWSEAGGSPLFGTGATAAPSAAALLNALAGHALDFDDTEPAGNTHPSVVIFPALWAVAATRGAIPGETAAAAYAAGFEAIARLGEAFNPRHYDRGWHGTGTLGAVGAAAAAARLIGLDQARFAHALSLALSQAGGLVAQFGSAAKPAQAGFAARAGVVAALMAEQGVEGRAEALDAPNGYAALVAGVDPERLDRAIARLDGRALADWGVAVKPYPCCGYLHRLVACAERLAGAARPEAIAAIRAELPDAHRGILIHDRPRTASEARFSLPFAVAAALIDGGLALERFAPAGIEDPAVRALMAKIEIAPQPRRRPELNSDPEQPDRLRIVLVSGEILEAEQGATPGSLDAPLGRAAIEAKFRAQAGGVAGADWSALSAWDRAADFAAAFAPFGAARRDAAGRADPTGRGQTGGAAAAFVDAR